MMDDPELGKDILKSPLGRLPPEIRAQVFKHLIKTRHLILRHWIAGGSGRLPPAVLLASKAFHSEAKDYLLDYQTLMLGLDGASPNKTLSNERRERPEDVARRLGVLRDLVMKTRHLRLTIRLEGPIVESTRSISLLLDWLKRILDLRASPVQRLEVDFTGHRWWYSKSDPGCREEDWLQGVNGISGEAPLPCDSLLDAVTRFRFAVLSVKITIVGKGGVSSAARGRLMEACEHPCELDPFFERGVTASQEQNVLGKVIDTYWRQASFMARLTNGETENFLRVYRFGDSDDKRLYASTTMDTVKQHVRRLFSKRQR